MNAQTLALRAAITIPIVTYEDRLEHFLGRLNIEDTAWAKISLACEITGAALNVADRFKHYYRSPKLKPSIVDAQSNGPPLPN